MFESPQPNTTASGNLFRFGVRFWIGAIVTGVAAGLAGGLLMKLLRFVQHSAWSYETGGVLQGVENAPAMHRVVILVAAGLLSAGALWVIHRSFGEGGGLSGAIWFRSGRLPLLRTIADGVLSIVIVALGAPLGREAAPKDTGGAFGSRLARWAKLTRAERRLLAACGAGAGMAAVYNLPFGGALFGLEVLLGTVELSMVIPAVVTSLIATSVAWLFLPNDATYSVPAFVFSWQQLPWALVTGPLIGLACVPYIRLISWASTQKPKNLNVIVMPPLALAAIGVLSIWLPEVLGNGRNVVQGVLENKMSLLLVGALIFLRPLVTAGALRAGVPGGLFTPTMTFGALLGALSGHIFETLWPGAPAGAYALLGSSAALAAATQGPASAIVITLELTRWTDAIMVPLMLAVATATIVTRCIESRSVYSGRLRIHFPDPSAGPAREIDRRYVVTAAATYAVVLERLLALPPEEPGLWVLDPNGQAVGVIRRDSIAASIGNYGDPRQTATAYDLAAPIETLTEEPHSEIPSRTTG